MMDPEDLGVWVLNTKIGSPREAQLRGGMGGGPGFVLRHQLSMAATNLMRYRSGASVTVEMNFSFYFILITLNLKSSGCCIGQCRYRIFPLLQKELV